MYLGAGGSLEDGVSALAASAALVASDAAAPAAVFFGSSANSFDRVAAVLAPAMSWITRRRDTVVLSPFCPVEVSPSTLLVAPLLSGLRFIIHSDFHFQGLELPTRRRSKVRWKKNRTRSMN